MRVRRFCDVAILFCPVQYCIRFCYLMFIIESICEYIFLFSSSPSLSVSVCLFTTESVSPALHSSTSMSLPLFMDSHLFYYFFFYPHLPHIYVLLNLSIFLSQIPFLNLGFQLECLESHSLDCQMIVRNKCDRKGYRPERRKRKIDKLSRT